jgi:hypothetical protein
VAISSRPRASRDVTQQGMISVWTGLFAAWFVLSVVRVIEHALWGAGALHIAGYRTATPVRDKFHWVYESQKSCRRALVSCPAS